MLPNQIKIAYWTVVGNYAHFLLENIRSFCRKYQVLGPKHQDSIGNWFKTGYPRVLKQ